MLDDASHVVRVELREVMERVARIGVARFFGFAVGGDLVAMGLRTACMNVDIEARFVPGQDDFVGPLGEPTGAARRSAVDDGHRSAAGLRFRFRICMAMRRLAAKRLRWRARKSQ